MLFVIPVTESGKNLAKDFFYVLFERDFLVLISNMVSFVGDAPGNGVELEPAATQFFRLVTKSELVRVISITKVNFGDAAIS